MIHFDEIGRLPAPKDNCAIAILTLPAGMTVNFEDATLTLSHTILEGHRLAVRPISAGEALLSWGFPFGLALRDIAPGEYVCNQTVLDELIGRSLDFPLPSAPNFSDQAATYIFNPGQFIPAEPLIPYAEPGTFMGYDRPGRGTAGTRNMIVLLGTSSMTAAFVRRLAEQLRPLAANYPNIDDIVASAHTEGAGEHNNNRELLLRTLAGFMVHPNVGAILAVDNGDEGVTNEMLRDFMHQHHYPLEEMPHEFLSRTSSFSADLEQASNIVQGWLEQVNAVQRTAVPLRHLKIALQCGGSDAFSGVSGNPLAAWLAKELLHHGGSANLAETDELVGAEQYVLNKVSSVETAEQFLYSVDRFQKWAERHGHSAAGNPSGGNLYRGLYNIYLKSIGAATKRHPEVPLERVIEYGAPMTPGRFHFMDSPGNDLESIAGQVASGCNLILFVTGNGSITNFPFVPTIKIVTTSQRYHMLQADMDINAGAYLDGTPLAELGRQSFDLMLDIVSGQLAAGERAGHAQVQIWRDWPLAAAAKPFPASKERLLDGRPLPIREAELQPPAKWTTTWDSIGLILPTSLCAGQIARMCAVRLNEHSSANARFVSLPHTEGCGASTQQEFIDVLLGYATHPMVKSCLLLEHGCEKTHNAFWQNQMRQAGIDPRDFGWASIQMDGGIGPVMEKIVAWFENSLVDSTQQLNRPVAQQGLANLRLGMLADGRFSASSAVQLATLARWIVSAGGTVIVPENDNLLNHSSFWHSLSPLPAPEPTLSYARPPSEFGLHIMQRPSSHWLETLTGLGATGVNVMLTMVEKRPLPGHPFIPLLQAIEKNIGTNSASQDFDIVLEKEQETAWAEQILNRVLATLSGLYTPNSGRQANVDFQITRGLLGVSL